MVEGVPIKNIETLPAPDLTALTVSEGVPIREGIETYRLAGSDDRSCPKGVPIREGIETI